MKILVRDAACFIGFHLMERLIAWKDDVVELDNYYQQLKCGKLAAISIDQGDIAYIKILQSNKSANFQSIQLKLEDKSAWDGLFEAKRYNTVCEQI